HAQGPRIAPLVQQARQLRQWLPAVAGERKLEAFRHDTDEHGRPIVDADGLTHERWIRPVPVLPDAVREVDDRRRAWSRVARRDTTAENTRSGAFPSSPRII